LQIKLLGHAWRVPIFVCPNVVSISVKRLLGGVEFVLRITARKPMFIPGDEMMDNKTEPTSELILHWDEQYRVGIPHFDGQHQRLLRLVALVAAAVGQKNHGEMMRALLLDIASFANVHFADEEQFMEQLEYPELENHRIERESFRKWIASLLDETGNDATIGIRVLRMAQAWLKTHLLISDQRYAEYFHDERHAARNLSSPYRTRQLGSRQ